MSLHDPQGVGPSGRQFAELRPLLFAVAYRMLGSAADAEDVVQEAWLRWAAATDVRDPRAWLVRVVTHLCLDQVRSARARRERYVGPWLPEPVLSDRLPEPDPLAVAERRDLVSLGALRLLERLSPAERAALVLREGLGMSHREIAAVVDVTEVAARQLLARARRRVAAPHGRAAASPEAHRRLVSVMLAAFDSGDVQPLLDLLREDVVALTDGGGERRAALRPIEGRDRVARWLAGTGRRFGPDVRAEGAQVNGRPGLVTYTGGRLDSVSAAVLDGTGRVAELLVVLAPGKLAFAHGQHPTRPL